MPGNDRTEILTAAVYARLRQLAAYEVGHTLGLAHNYIASAQNRASVMDYPHPLIELRPDTTFDLLNAYASGIGEWDKVAIRWGYSEFSPETDERSALDNIIADAAKRGLTFITDADSRPFGSAHPRSHLWDNGPNAVDELTRILKIRSVALSRFGENNIPIGAPLSTLDEVLAPLYFLHRYQTEAASKMLGGNDYSYALRGDGQSITKTVPAAEQRRALKVLLQTLSAAEAAADLTVSLILNPQRVARLVQYHAQNRENPSADEVIYALVKATWGAKQPSGLQGEVARTVKYVVLRRLIALALDQSAPPQVRASAAAQLKQVRNIPVTHNPDPYAAGLIETFERDPKQLQVPVSVAAPLGQPIGDEDLSLF